MDEKVQAWVPYQRRMLDLRLRYRQTETETNQ